MRIKKYVAKSMREALVDIKNEFGDDAIILKTRKMPKKSFPFSMADIEVTAAIDDETKKQEKFPPLTLDKVGVYKRPRPSCVVDSGDLIDVQEWHPPVGVAIKPDLLLERKKKGDPALSPPFVEIKEDLKQLSDLVKSVIKQGSAPVEGGFAGGWARLYGRLLDAEVKADTAGTLIQHLIKNAPALSNGHAEQKMLEILGNHFPVAGPVKCKKRGPSIIAFVGPTGAGKTTTLAKLVANCCLSKRKKVSIITADTYRIAAIDQIKSFADIVKVSLQVVFTPEDVPAALAACINDDLVFVDTAGRSPKNSVQMEELSTLLAALHPDEIHLVLSATTKDSDLLDTIKRFGAFGANRLIFTKLDETGQVGNIYNAVSASGIPVSFLTAGQSVPDDIELAHGARFVARLWEGTTA